MSCHEVGRLVQRYLDDETDQATADAVAAHLEDCRRCGMEADTYRDIKAALRRNREPMPDIAVRRLRQFGDRITAGDPLDP